MAILVRRNTSIPYDLSLSEVLIGRARTSHLILDSEMVSSAHAIVRWTRAGWQLHDLDSRNGTFVDGRRLTPGEHIRLCVGITLAFGDTADLFDLTDDRPPVPRAGNLSGEWREWDGSMLCLPCPGHPEYTIFEEQGRWKVELPDGVQRDVAHGDTLPLGADRWTLYLPVVITPTQDRDDARLTLQDLVFRFAVSRDEERIALSLDHAGQSLDMGIRAHMELLLRLAEARLEHRDRSEIAIAEEGWIWVSDLLGRLGIQDDRPGRTRVRQYIYQARRQIADLNVVDSMKLIQRRDPLDGAGHSQDGQIRIGARRIEIHRESSRSRGA